MNELATGALGLGTGSPGDAASAARAEPTLTELARAA